MARQSHSSPPPTDYGQEWGHCLDVFRLVVPSVSVLPPPPHAVRVPGNRKAGSSGPCVRVPPCHAPRVWRRSSGRDVGALSRLAIPVNERDPRGHNQGIKNCQPQCIPTTTECTSMLGGLCRVCESQAVHCTA